MPCSYLEFRTESGERAFEHERPYCTAAERFVQPMRADVCSERFDLEPVVHCEIYREQQGLE